MSRFINVSKLLNKHLRDDFGEVPGFIDGGSICRVCVGNHGDEGYCLEIDRYAYPCKSKDDAISAAFLIVEASEIVKGLHIAGVAAVSERQIERLSHIMKGLD